MILLPHGFSAPFPAPLPTQVKQSRFIPQNQNLCSFFNNFFSVNSSLPLFSSRVVPDLFPKELGLRSGNAFSRQLATSFRRGGGINPAKALAESCLHPSDRVFISGRSYQKQAAYGPWPTVSKTGLGARVPGAPTIFFFALSTNPMEVSVITVTNVLVKNCSKQLTKKIGCVISGV